MADDRIDPEKSKSAKAKHRYRFRLILPFGVPATLETCAARIATNISHFGLFYTLVLCLGLSISLVPERQISLLLLFMMTTVTCLYVFFLRLLPNSVILRKIMDRRLVLAFLANITLIGMIATGAAIHVFATAAIGTPVVLLHAVFWTRENLQVIMIDEDEVEDEHEEGPTNDENSKHPDELRPLV